MRNVNHGRPGARREPSGRAVARRLVACAAVLVVCAVADGRGGGGGNFGGGGGGGGFGGGGGGFGGGDGGGGGEGLIWLILWLLTDVPWIGVPLLLAFTVVLIWAAKTGRLSYQQQVIRRGGRAVDDAMERRAVERIRQRDPQFDPKAFALRVETAFRKVQDSWCAHELTPLRPFVSDGIHERFSIQLDEQRWLGYRDRVRDLVVHSVRLAETVVEGPFEILTLRITASMADYRVCLATGELVSGSTRSESFSEYYSFLRRRGAGTRAESHGLMEGDCPNCGASISVNQWTRCEHCESLLRSGEHDWVLVEITQESEWSPRSARHVPGVDALRTGDPEFCVQHLEDRASVMFWRWVLAPRTGDTGLLLGVASDDFVDRARADIAARRGPGGERSFVGECGVGQVTLRGVLQEGDRHRAAVQVTWSGTQLLVPPRGEVERIGRTGVRAHLLVLERSADATSRPQDVVSSAHCGGCGAPHTGGGSACEHCGGRLADVNTGWVLTDVLPILDPAAREFLGRLNERTALRDSRVAPAGSPSTPRAPVVRAEVLAWMAAAAHADGRVDDLERTALETMAARAGVRRRRFEEVLSAAAAGELPEGRPGNWVESVDWLAQAMRVALSDGRITPEEEDLLARLGKRCGLSAADVRIQFGRTRKTLFEEARAARRNLE